MTQEIFDKIGLLISTGQPFNSPRELANLMGKGEYVILANEDGLTEFENTIWDGYFNPTTKIDTLRAGLAGTVLGVSIYTDAFMEAEHKMATENKVVIRLG